MEETITRKRRSKWDVTSEPQNPIEHDGDPPIKSNNSVGCDVFISEMKISDRSPTTIDNGIYGFDAIMESKVTLSLPSKMEADPNVLSTKIEADKFVEYSQMKDEDPPIKSNNSAEGDVFISKIKSPDHYPTTINNGSYGPNNDTAMILSFPSKTETDPDVVSTTKTDADKFVEYSKMKDEDFDLLPGKRVKTEISAKKHHSNKTMSPGHESWRQRSPAMSLSHSGKSRRSRSRSRSWSRSRSRGRSRTRSCSRSPSYGHGRRSLRSRSRSRSPYYRSRREPDDSMDMRRPRIPCRDFAVGRCHRGIDCRYIHDDTSRRPYNPFHDVDERKVEKENVNVSKEPIDNTHRDTRGYPRYSKEQVENTRRNERESLQNSREPIDNTNKNERESFRDSREPIDNRHRYERENFHDSREPIDDINRNERENFRDSREPIDTRRNKRENYRDSREPIVSTQRNERENYRDSREPIDPRHRNEGENIRDSREQIENRWRDERDDLGDSREPMEYTRRNERDNVRDSRDRFTRNDSRPPVACYDFSRGRCQRGSDCRYAHHDSSSFDNGRSYSSSRDEYRTRTQRVLRDTVCKFFADGCCRRGQSCSFSHVILGPRDGGNGQNQQQHQNQTQIQNQNQNLNLNQPQNAINPLPFPLQPSNIQMPQLVPPMPVDEQMPQAMLSMIQNGQNQFVPQPNSNFNIPVQNLPFVPPQNFNLLPSNTVGQQVQQALPFAAPNFVGPTLQNIPFNDNPIPPQLPNPENQIIASEIQSSNISNDIAQKVVTSEQAAKITNISASLAMFFENQGALNPQTATESVTETDTKKNTEVEVREAVKETGTVDEKKEGEGEESKQTKDGKGMKMFKCAIVDFVKDALKPNWKEGQLSREAHKTIVKKVVEKVTGAMQSQNIPHTQEKIDIYMSHSKPKLSKLVQAYVEKYVKG